MTQTLDLALIGNSGVAALVDATGEIVWALHAAARRRSGVLLAAARARRADGDFGFFAVELAGFSRSEQEYLDNTAVVVTRLYDRRGGAIEIMDFAPRFLQFGRMFCPMTLVRQVRLPRRQPAGHDPAATGARLRRRAGARSRSAATTCAMSAATSCCAPRPTARSRRCSRRIPFVLQGTVTFVLGPDETLQGSVARGRAPFFRGDDRLLARLGAGPQHPVRVAGRSHSRRDLAQARRGGRYGSRSSPRSRPRSRKPRTAAATGITATAGCATRTSRSARSTG